MRTCKFTITTSVDERETTVVYEGKIDVDDEKKTLTYQDGGANVCIILQRGVALIDRQGDYSLRLHLEEGKTQEGFLGIGEAKGNILTKTHRIKYSQEGNVFKLSLRYDLIFSEDEAQKMKLNLKGLIKDR